MSYSCRREKNGTHSVTSHSGYYLCYCRDETDAAVVAECVNACAECDAAGVPTAALAGFVRRAVEAIKAYKEEYLCGSWTEDGPPDADRVAALVRAALALLEDKA